MRKHEVLYDWPVAKIAVLADSGEMEQFAATIVDETIVESFAGVTEKIRGIGADLHTAKAAREIADQWVQLEDLLRKLAEEFEDYSPILVQHMRLYVLIAKKLVIGIDIENAESILNEQLDSDAFFLQKMDSKPPLAWFVHENKAELLDSLIVMSARDLLENKSKEFDNAIVSPEMLFHLLSAISSLEDIPDSHLVLTRSKTPPIEEVAIDAFARLMILASGCPVTEPQRYSEDVSVLEIDAIKVGPNFQQWNELLQVISDYNSVDDLLIKYLMLYHVVENLMFKLPIVELERQNRGKMFSIRDFRQLYKRVEVDEKRALKRMFKKVFPMDATPGTSFQQHVVSRWQMLDSKVAAGDIEGALGKLGITKNRQALPYSDFVNDGSAADIFTQMVYSIRCAIVHNKETEFHLTHASLNSAYLALLADFLIPSIEEMCFALIGSPNSHVWYQHREMALYQ